MNPAKYDMLILDDGELSEIRAAAHMLGAAVHRDMDAPGTPLHWPLVVSSTRHLDELESIPIDLSAKRVLVIDQLSQTLRARMRRARVDFFLRRPVHPEALRLLLLHCLYKGPERRRPRVPIGAPVRFRSGFRRGEGVLADLSEEGCRILTGEPLRRQQKLLVFLPRADQPARTFYVRAEVVRAGALGSAPRQMALRFYSVNASAQRRISDLMSAYQQGPARFRGTTAALPTEGADPALESIETGRSARSGVSSTPERSPHTAIDAAISRDLPSPGLGGEQSFPLDIEDAGATPDRRGVGLEKEPDLEIDEETQPVSIDGPETEEAEPRSAEDRDDERRREPRRAFSRHVVALDRSATRVLLGRDLSVGGMRVDRHAALLPRKTFRLSIHVGEEELPLVVRARVARDDGENGVLLRFEQLGFAVQEHLRKSLRELPVLAPREGAEPEVVLLTEILDDFGDARPTHSR